MSDSSVHRCSSGPPRVAVVDWIRVLGAMLGGRVTGAFTITMQLAGKLFPEDINRRDRSLGRKVRKMRVALEIEKADWSEIIGTGAGEDTPARHTRSEKARERVAGRLKGLSAASMVWHQTAGDLLANGRKRIWD